MDEVQKVKNRRDCIFTHNTIDAQMYLLKIYKSQSSIQPLISEPEEETM
jgi:hypothetical protein